MAMRAVITTIACPSLRRSRAALGAAVLATGMAFIDVTALNVALPSLQASLPATASELLWILDAYAIPLTALLLVAGAVSDRFGVKRVFAMGIVLFAAASLACGFAHGATALIAARALQGIGAAMMIPGSLALIASMYPTDARGRAIGLWSACSVLALALGPVLGGLFAQHGLWRLVFFINLPLAAVALALLLAVPARCRGDAAALIDLAGAVLAVLALGGLSYGCLEGARAGLSDLRVAGSLVVGTLGLLGFIAVELRAAAPMLPLQVFRNRTLLVACALILILYSAFHAMTVMLPQNLVHVQGYAADEAGFALLPIIVLVAVAAPVAGRMTDRFGPRRSLVLGTGVAGLGLLLFAGTGITNGPQDFASEFLVPCILFGAGMGLTITPLSAMVISALGNERFGLAAGINSAVSRLASVLAVAFLAFLAGQSSPPAAARLDSLETFAATAYLSAAMVWLGGIAAMVLLRDDAADARPSYRIADKGAPLANVSE